MLVDDEENLRSMLEAALRHLGFDVQTAATGREALAAAVADQPAVIVLDVMLPDLDGPATLALIREHCRGDEVPALFLTAKAQAFDADRLKQLYAQGAIAKPFDPMTLHAQISSALGWG